jgi:alkaline phosphatase
MNKFATTILAAFSVASAAAFAEARNVILFIGDGAGVSSLNAAGIYKLSF